MNGGSTGLGRPFAAVRLMRRLYRFILPEVGRQLAEWREAASRMPDPELRRQALASLSAKRFHCEGGAVYAALNLPLRHVLIPLIVAFQTISDYLDNLCDRSTSQDPRDFRFLHQSMLDAVDPAAPLHDYYALRAEQADGGYLERLVKTCQSCILLLPSYAIARPHILELVSLYCDLQVHKHISLDEREQALFEWWDARRADYPDLEWNEFAAACGSTLGVFMLFVAAAEPEMEARRAEAIRDGYFPYICGLHILLDYLIDLQEDREGGDLNFCSYYADERRMLQRFRFIIQEAGSRVPRLPEPRFQRLLIEGLLALYLSDPKVAGQPGVRRAAVSLMREGSFARLFFWLNSKWIRRSGRGKHTS